MRAYVTVVSIFQDIQGDRNHWTPVALTPIVSKCFEKLVRKCSNNCLNNGPVAVCILSNNSYTDDAIAMGLYTVLLHMDDKKLKDN